MNLKKAPATALPIVAGAIGAKLVKNLAGKVTQNDKIRAGAALVFGLLLISNKSKAMQGVGAGMIAVGGADLVVGFVPQLAGIEDMDLGDVLNGPDDYVGAYEDMNGAGSVLNGSGEGVYGDDF